MALLEEMEEKSVEVRHASDLSMEMIGRPKRVAKVDSRRHIQMDVTIYILETGRDSLDPVCLKVWDLRNQRFAVPLHCE